MKNAALWLVLVTALGVAVSVFLLPGCETHEVTSSPQHSADSLTANYVTDVGKFRGLIQTYQEENAKLRQELSDIKIKNGLLTEQLKQVPSELTQTESELAKSKTETPHISKISEPESTGYWMTYSSQKRHNPSCRYYRDSNGRFCTEGDGIACKLCGG